MNEALEARAEILRLARLLDSPPEQLAYLEQVPAPEIRELRDGITEMLFTAHGHTLQRLAAASRLLPIGLVALMSEHAFGAVLSARIAGLLDPGRAVEVAKHLPTSFLADVAIDLDPRRARAVIAGIPPDQAEAITRELADRGEFVTMGRFVGQLPAETLQRAVGVLADGDILRTAFVMEEKERLDELVELLGEDRLPMLLDAARDEQLWGEVIDLLRHLNSERQATLIERAMARGEETIAPILGDDQLLAQLVDALADSEAGVTLLRSLDRSLQRRLIKPLGRMDPERRARIAQRAREAGLLEQLGPLTDALAA